ncbi:MAG TPA: serine/threonine-protein kinase PknK, partial [Leptospiraceae bacterium]|nr:serine/threonine-protein kinase PknK [Leptospiraceae bacterium]
MINLNGYSISEKIHEGEKSILYRGKKKDQPVIIKILNNDYPSTSELSKFKHEYDILENINSDYIIKTISIEKYKNSIAIVFEDIGGESLATLYNSVSSYSIKEILNIMILSIKALGEVHKLNLVHKDIKPHNIIFNKSSQVLKIIDFGNASLLVKQNSFISLNSSIEGTLAYISPEQTGRMNRTVDYRTDYYSLGVTFYRILTGGLPFLAKDPIELVHSHIAKNPISPFQKNKTPKPISDIIVKLLQKNPEDRYQSSSGILYDLEKCLKLLEEKGLASLDTESFGIGEFDFSPKFQIPEKLYGREKEINQIIDTFKKVAEGNTELLLISGRSGIGKSVLINEINKPITKYKGYFASGKYDTFKKTIPYRAISYAVQSLIQQILTESSTSIQSWKKNILDAIGTNGKIIIDVIPELETLIGEQPPVPELGTTESQNRFNIVFQNFIKAICSKEHPIAIFLDDLQWADIPSINLIQALLSNPDLKYLFLMLSFRDNEVLPKDPFSIMLDDLKNGGLKFNKISLEPISLTDISSLVSDTLNSADIIAKELAKVLFEKTKGNPFFVNELFKSFYEKEFIQYKNNNWIWDIKKIQDVKISENVIDLMLEKVKELSDSAIEKLKLAACIGSWFKQEVFFKILDKTESEAKEDLLLLANEGFLRLGEFDVNFVHDKIREATYTLISETERSRYHYTIGNTYLSMLDKYKLEDHIFTIVNQLNQGLAYITSEEEKVKLKELNRIAGNKAIASNAYDAALGFYQNSINQLPENSWEDNYFYTLDLYTNRARSEYLSKEYLSAEKTFDLILTKAKTPLDKIVIYELKSSMYVSQNKMLEAIVILKQALKSFGVNLPNNPTEISPLPEIIKFKLKFGKRQTEDLLNHTLTTEKKSLAIMGLLNALSAPAFLAQPALFPVIVLKMVNFSLTHGNTPLSPFAYAAFGIIQGSALGDFEAGYKFGKLALDLIKKIGEQTKPIECRTYFLFATMINHWKHHAKENKALYNHAFEKGMEAGDLQYGSYSLNNIFFQGVMIRENLSILSENFIKYRKSILSLQQHNAYQLYQLNEQFVSNMRDLTENKLMLVGEFYDETKVLPELIESKNANALFDFYVCKTRLEYFFGDLHQALEYSSLASTHEAAMFGMMFVPEQVFFDSLICAKLILNTKDKKKSKDYKKRLDKNYKRIKKWGENCQANYGHKLHILQGLIYQIENNQDKALSSFDQAIELSQQYDYILEEALANEFIASIWLERNKEPFAYIYLNAAHYAYKKWGCEPKVKQLESKYPQLKRQTKHKFNNESS